jgi:uncharacterized protein YndB with AHSA1/START domain
MTIARLSHKVHVNAARDRTFDALATTEGLKGWYTPNIEGEVAEGEEATFRFTGRRPFRWRIVDVTPDSGVRWECIEGPGNAAGTSVAVRLSDADDGTVVELDHEGWQEGDEAFTTCNTLWGALMDHLRKYAETGHPDPAFQ